MRHWLPLGAKTIATRSLPHPENEHQWNINDFCSCILGNLTGDWLKTSINEVLAAFRGKNKSDTLPTPSWGRASVERQWLLVLHLGECKCRIVAIIHIWSNGGLFNRNSAWHICYPFMYMSVNAASKISGLAYCIIKPSRGYRCSQQNCWPPS